MRWSGPPAGSERATARPRATHVVAVAVQFALALALMIGAGLLVKSAYRLAGREFHFVADHVMMFDLALPVPQRPSGICQGTPCYEIVQSPAPTYARVLDRLRAIAGVESAGGSSYPLVNSLILPSVPSRCEAPPPPPSIDRWRV